MVTSRALVAGVGLGAGISYFLDPDRGARRRARLRDQVAHVKATARRAAGQTGRDAAHRVTGTVASMRARMQARPVDDCLLVDRVRAKLGRHVSHPHAIGVVAADGVVRLRGLVLEREVEPLLRAVRHLCGVVDIVDQLERHAQAGNIPALQGGRAPLGDRFDVMQRRWAPATRALAAGAGVAAAGAGVMRRDVAGACIAAAGAILVARAGTNLSLAQLSGMGTSARAIDVQKTMTIRAPVSQVYQFWSAYENFPRFMSRVLDVTPNVSRPRQSHWKVAGPGGTAVQFDAEITRNVPNELVAWKTRPGAAVTHAGLVRFEDEPRGGTRVHIRMSYSPPAGWLGHAFASTFGVDPKHSMDADLVRMKTLIETGHAPRDAARSA